MEQGHVDFETVVRCGTGADAYDVVIEFPMSNRGARIYLKDRNHPDFKGKEGEELVDIIVLKSLQSTPTMLSRLKDGKLHDGPNGKPAYRIMANNKICLEKRYQKGELTDGANGEAAFQVFENGMLVRATHYKNGKVTMMKHFTYTEAVIKEEDKSLKGRLKRIFNRSAAPPLKEWKQCNVTVEYRSPYRLTTDGPRGTPGLQTWQMGYELVEGKPSFLKFSKQATLVFAKHFKNGKPGKEPNSLAKRLLRKPWPAR